MKAEVIVPDNYRPADDEPFMNDTQLAYFRRKLLAWKSELMSDSKETIETLQDNTRAIPDISDRARRQTARLNCARATGSVNWCQKLMRPCAGLKRGNTAIAKRRVIRSRCGA